MASSSYKVITEGSSTESEGDLKATFKKYGAVQDFTLGVDPITGKPTGSAVLIMVPTNSEAADQLKTLDSLDGGLKTYLAEANSDPKTSTSKISHPDSTSHGNQNFTPVHLSKISVFTGDHIRSSQEKLVLTPGNMKCLVCCEKGLTLLLLLPLL
ncbi:hypothetical protein HOLleu_16612 [Holothuria leucospilota]|uniref:RRM domain-containing protein n=1 Tax=Holothuria leucospilota TaxID=206669 RepID=A0A9Q1H7X8_HOLLE|nr:hypothetical protein HOLleu_16612 [Holothuria leucospilota]